MSIVMEFPDTVDEFMEQYKSIDTECVYSNGIEYVPIFRMKQWFEHLKVKPKTNADRIRSMTDEELLEFLYWEADGSGKTPEQWISWLKQEVK